jgi:hypothetical protein
VKGIILLTRATALITDPVRIMEGIQAGSASQVMTDPTMSAALVIGLVALITFGGLAIGHGGMGKKFGFTAITLCEDTKPVLRSTVATSAGYQVVASPPSKPRKAPTSVSGRSWRFR